MLYINGSAAEFALFGSIIMTNNSLLCGVRFKWTSHNDKLKPVWHPVTLLSLKINIEHVNSIIPDNDTKYDETPSFSLAVVQHVLVIIILRKITLHSILLDVL